MMYQDRDTGVEFYVRYLHMQGQARKADGTLWRPQDSIRAGEQVGFLGNTGPGSTGAHLHMDVHRGVNLFGGSNFSHSIDPRAFFEYRFVHHWPGLNIRQ